jgi:hypothetical protein
MEPQKGSAIIEEQPTAQPFAEESARVEMIRKLAGKAIPSEIVDRCILEGRSVDETREEFLKVLREGMTIKAGSPEIKVGRDLNRESLPEAMVDAILTRAGVSLLCEDRQQRVISGPDGKCQRREPHKRASEFMQMRLPDMARTLLIAAGLDEARAFNDSMAVRKAIELSQRSVAVSTLSLPAILGDAVGRSLRASYEEYPIQWPKFCKRTTAKNFKEITRIQLKELDNLEVIYTGAEYSHATPGESEEAYQLFKYGKIISLANEHIVNDDLQAFRQVPGKLGAAARRLEDALAFGILSANDNMDDGIALFDNSHANLGGAGAISVATLDEARKLLRRQTSTAAAGAENVYINLTPAVLIVPVTLEGAAEKLLMSEFDPADTNTRAANPWHKRLELVTHPILDASSTSNWFVSAAPEMGGIEMCFLEGQPTPVVEKEFTFEVDALRYKVRHVAAAKAIDYRALVKNPYAG